MCRKNRIILLRTSLCLLPFSHSCAANLNPVVPAAGIRSCLRRGVVMSDRSRLWEAFSDVLGIWVDSKYGYRYSQLSQPIFIQPLSVEFSCQGARGDTRCTANFSCGDKYQVQALFHVTDADIHSDAVITQIQYLCLIFLFFEQKCDSPLSMHNQHIWMRSCDIAGV